MLEVKKKVELKVRGDTMISVFEGQRTESYSGSIPFQDEGYSFDRRPYIFRVYSTRREESIYVKVDFGDPDASYIDAKMNLHRVLADMSAKDRSQLLYRIQRHQMGLYQDHDKLYGPGSRYFTILED